MTLDSDNLVNSTLSGGLDFQVRAWGEQQNKNPIVEEARIALAKNNMTAWTNVLSRLPKDKNTQKTINFLLVDKFSDEAADCLRESGHLLEKTIAKEGLDERADILGWVCKTPEGVALTESVMTGYEDNLERMDANLKTSSKQKSLALTLIKTAKNDPNGVLDCLIKMDIETAFGRHDIRSSWAHWSHPGMDVLKVVISADDVEIDEEKLKQAFERLVSTEMLTAALGSERAKEISVAAMQIDPLMKAAMGARAHDYGNISACMALDKLEKNSAKFRGLMNFYWVLGNHQEFNKDISPAYMKLCANTNTVNSMVSGSIRAYNMIDALLMTGHPWAKNSMNEDTPNGEIFWKALGRSKNLHCFLQTCSSSEIVEMLPAMMNALGKTWEDKAGNNLGHLLVRVTERAEKQAILTLLRLPGGEELITKPNKDGETPLTLVEKDGKWSDGRNFHTRLLSKLTRKKRDKLADIGKSKQKESGAKTKTSQMKM